MPLTFPSHAAAILPFCGRRASRLPPSALVVGSLAPDLAYLFDTGSTNFHALPGVLFPCLPVAALFWFGVEALLLPTLRRTLPVWLGVEWGRLAATRGLPVTRRGYFDAALALGLGTLTHLAWDAFTHSRRFPANVLYAHTQVAFRGLHLGMASMLQLLSSVAGAVLVALFLAWRYRELPGARPGGGLTFAAVASIVLGCLLAAWLLLAGRWGLQVATSPFGGAWLLFWYAARGLMFGLLVACCVETYLHSRSRRLVTSRARANGSGDLTARHRP